MPTFFYAWVVFTLVWWSLTFVFAGIFAPSAILAKLVLSLMLYVAFSFTSTVLFFLVFYYKHSKVINKRPFFKKSAKYGFYGGFVLAGYLSLKIFEIDTAVNLGLFLVLCVTLWAQIRSK